MAPRNTGGDIGSLDGDREDRDMVIPPIPSDDDRSKDPAVWDLVVVGAGVAGAAFAYQQGKDGRRVLLLERDLSQPDRIIGELLQPGGYLKLKELGLAGCVDGIGAQKVKGYVMYKAGEEAIIPYPTEDMPEDVAGRSFHHGRFIMKLRQAAKSAPNVTVRTGVVKRLVNEAGQDWEEGEVVTGVRYKAADGAEVVARAHLTVVCDGMYSTFRTKLATPDINLPSYFVGVLLKNVTLPHPGHGHVVLGQPSPALFYPISDKEVRCLVDYPGPKLPSSTNGELQKYLREVVGPQVPESLRAAYEEAISKGRVRSMQNKQITCTPLHPPGALLLGDSFNMRHPLTGGGMTVALADCNLLGEMLRPLPDLTNPAATADATAAFYVKRKPIAATINTLANALYKVFCASEDRAQEEMRQACFDYLKKGGWYSAGPISLLSGLNPRPSVLVAHFFMVALFGVGRLLWPRPALGGLAMGGRLLYSASKIILPIISAEGIRAVFLPFMAGTPRLTGRLRKAASELNLAVAAAAAAKAKAA